MPYFQPLPTSRFHRLLWAASPRPMTVHPRLFSFWLVFSASAEWHQDSAYKISASCTTSSRCQASSRPHARFRKVESRRTLSEPFSPLESKLVIIHTCKYPGGQLRSASCCSSRSAQKEDRKCNLRNLKSRSRPSKWSSAGAYLESAVSSSNPLIAIRCANGIRSILDSLTKAKARCFRGANTTTRKRNTLQFGLFSPPPLNISIPAPHRS